MAGKTARARSGGELPVVLCAGLATRAGRQPRKKEKVVRKRPHEIARGAQREVELRASVEEICCVELVRYLQEGAGACKDGEEENKEF